MIVCENPKLSSKSDTIATAFFKTNLARNSASLRLLLTVGMALDAWILSLLKRATPIEEIFSSTFLLRTIYFSLAWSDWKTLGSECEAKGKLLHTMEYMPVLEDT